MKKCHACGQKLPLKAGDVVEGVRLGKLFQGVITLCSMFDYVHVVTFDGRLLINVPQTTLTRLHGYYRITSREPRR